MAITIKEIAERAGVSRGTVDRVLHNRGGVKPEIEARIRQIAEQHSFKMNKAGRILAVRKQPITIGCLMPGVGNLFFDDVIRGYTAAQEELEDYGVSLKIKNIRGFSPEDHMKAIQELLDEGCKALCLSTLDVPEVCAFIDGIISRGIPVIAVNTDIPDTNRICYIGSDYYKGGKTAAQLLSKLLGKREMPLKIAVFTGSLNIKGHNERITGFVDGLSVYHVKHSIINVIEGFDNDEYVFLPALALFEQHPEINCIYIAASCVAGVCTALKQSAMYLQAERIRIVVFDDLPETKKLIREGLIDFTICQSPYQQGYQAIHALFNYILDNHDIPEKNIFMNTIIKIAENLDDAD